MRTTPHCSHYMPGVTFKRYSGQWICKHLARDYDTSQSGTTTPMTPISSEHKTCNGDVVVDSAAGHQLDYAPTCLGMLWKRPILWVACQLSDLKKNIGLINEKSLPIHTRVKSCHMTNTVRCAFGDWPHSTILEELLQLLSRTEFTGVQDMFSKNLKETRGWFPHSYPSD